MAGKKNPLYKSFGYAFSGILETVRRERNMKIHCAAGALVILFGFFLRISLIQWCICLGLCALVMSLELVNTALEAVVDLACQEVHPLAKKAKDAAAGAVLTAAIFAAIVGCLIFLPKLAAMVL